MVEIEHKRILSAAADFLWCARFQQHSDDFVATNAPLFIGAVCRVAAFLLERTSLSGMPAVSSFVVL